MIKRIALASSLFLIATIAAVRIFEALPPRVAGTLCALLLGAVSVVLVAAGWGGGKSAAPIEEPVEPAELVAEPSDVA